MAKFSKKISLPELWLIRLYQKTLSFDHGPLKVFYPNGYCRYYPSCSDYGRVSVERFGVIKGTYLAILRILRCHPWAKGGSDAVPEK